MPARVGASYIIILLTVFFAFLLMSSAATTTIPLAITRAVLTGATISMSSMTRFALGGGLHGLFNQDRPLGALGVPKFKGDVFQPLTMDAT